MKKDIRKRLFWLLFSYQGRINRKVFWLYLLTVCFSFFILSSLWLVTNYLPVPLGIPIRFLLCIILGELIYTQLPITVKRLHDMNHSGWWYLVFMIPFIGLIIALMSCGLISGTQGTNRYGESPI